MPDPLSVEEVTRIVKRRPVGVAEWSGDKRAQGDEKRADIVSLVGQRAGCLLLSLSDQPQRILV